MSIAMLSTVLVPVLQNAPTCYSQSSWATSTIPNSRLTCLTTLHEKVGFLIAVLPLGPFVHAKIACSYTHLLLVLYAAVTELCSRVFGIWTLLTCALCCICARNPCVPSIYGRLKQAAIGYLTVWTSVLTKVVAFYVPPSFGLQELLFSHL